MYPYSVQNEVFEYQGFSFRVTVEQDCDMGAPWEEHDGHGIVSDWTTRDKASGERVLYSDRYSKRFYDVQGTMARAYAEGWGLSDKSRAALMYRLGKKTGRDFTVHPLTKGEIVAEAVRLDFEYCRGWCNEDWQWQWIKVELLDDDKEPIPGFEDSIGGVEGSDDDYLVEIAYQCADNVIYQYKKDLAKEAQESEERAYWAARDVVTVA
jgi:hypothetical protein